MFENYKWKKFMEQNNLKLNFEELKEIQTSFEESIKVIERHVAESISNKNEIPGSQRSKYSKIKKMKILKFQTTLKN